ncbi:MAG: hypothetical protein HY544_05105 [Candidatus Diapherotrites archaeon]|uniref:Uncharacterized protein n=1 Tax=Candidatus Iainarchaeum sp. TaxID=3101447 RepID=A0A8T3YNM6_9ARCH|nr:hypothetical protein [Candidatus Diapherotrites archaeon]
MAAPFYVPVIVPIFTGTVIFFFLTSIFGNKYASLQRTFIFVLGRLSWLHIVQSQFSFYDYSPIVLFIGYILWFRFLYHVKWLRAMRFIFLSTVFGISSELILYSSLTDFFLPYYY